VADPVVSATGDAIDGLRDRLAVCQTLLVSDPEPRLLDWPAVNVAVAKVRTEVIALGNLLGDVHREEE
jgi:hypothetical protein